MSNKVVFFEVLGKDGASLRAFYERAFGWSTSVIPGPMDYGLVSGAGIGGGIGTADGVYPPRTTFYIEVDDVEQAFQRIEAAGGKRIGDPRPTPNGGAMAFFADVDGHIVGLFRAGTAE
jgi:uncharacterized protein